jgi:Tannase and feruloyl esterase
MRLNRSILEPHKPLFGLALALMCSAAFIPSRAAAAPPSCSSLAAQLLAGEGVSAATSAIQLAASPHLSYCLVNITVSELAGPKDGYLPGQKQMINVGIGLPLSPADGGAGGSVGAWNERIQDLGGGGYAGSVGSVTGATDAGYAGSSTDTGHPASATGTFALNPDNTLNFGLIRDFAFNGIHQQAVWTRKLVEMYYGRKPEFTYWNGCSTGGRQGHQQAQKYPNDFDGILAGAPAFNWDRFIPAEQWGEIVMNEEVGAPISVAKLNAVTSTSLAACDALDGIKDGIIQDPRACHYKASASACTGNPALCLTSQEASAVNKIWDGPPGPKDGERLWFGLERGTTFLGLDAPSPFSISTQWFQYWVDQNPAFDWHTITEASFADQFKQSELKFHDVIGTDDPDLSEFRDHGGKMIIYHGLADLLIMPRGSYNYYNRATKHAGGLSQVQKFYRFFPYPGNSHCGGNPDQPNAPLIDSTSSGALFQALVNWVEHGTAPDSIIAYNNATPALATVSRPICKYPDKLTYNGTGSTSVASSFTCKHESHDDLMAEEKTLPDADLIEDRGHDHDDHDH